MIRLGFCTLMMAVSLYAGNLSFESGVIKGHTEVFGDSSIDPMFKKSPLSIVHGDFGGVFARKFGGEYHRFYQ